MIDTTASVYVALFGRFTLGLVFALSGLTKATNLAGFAASVTEFRLLPARAVRPVALGIVAAELCTAGALLAGVGTGIALAAAVVLLTVFTGVLTRALRRGQRVACHCFGELSARSTSWSAVGRNVLLIALGVVALATAASGGPLPPAANTAAIGLLSLGALAVLALLGEMSVLVGGPSDRAGALGGAQREGLGPPSVASVRGVR